MKPDLGLEEVGEEVLGRGYETGTAADPRVPSIEWKKNVGLYRLKVYSEEFLQNDSRAVAGNTLEDVFKKQVSEENDFYVEVAVPTDGLRPEREIYTFSEEELEQGLREVIEEYAEDY